MTNYERTASWLRACGKEPSPNDLSVQIGCHLEEFCEFLKSIRTQHPSRSMELWQIAGDLERIARLTKTRHIVMSIPEGSRVDALDALCDSEVTGNGVAFLAGFDKVAADDAVLASNDAKLVNGKPVILEGGKIGKPEGWRPPHLAEFV